MPLGQESGGLAGNLGIDDSVFLTADEEGRLADQGQAITDDVFHGAADGTQQTRCQRRLANCF